MDVLSFKTSEIVEKEIWVYLLAYNVIRIIMAQSALQVGCSRIQTSLKHSTQLWLAWGRYGQVAYRDSWLELLSVAA